MINIWAKFPGIPPEKIDECSRSELGYMLREYQLAYGKDVKVWSGRRKDEPKGGDK